MINTKDYNQIQLESALLKVNYADLSSNQSSNNTDKTGKKTLNTMINRRLSGAPKELSNISVILTHLGLVKKTSTNSNKIRLSSQDYSKPQEIRSEAEVSKYSNPKSRLSSKKHEPVKAFQEIPNSYLIQQTMDNSRHERKKFLITLYKLSLE